MLSFRLRRHVSAEPRLNERPESLRPHKRVRAHTLTSSSPSKTSEDLRLKSSSTQDTLLLRLPAENNNDYMSDQAMVFSDQLSLPFPNSTGNSSATTPSPSVSVYGALVLSDDRTKQKISPSSSSNKNLGHPPIFRVANGHAANITDYNKPRTRIDSDSSIEDNLTAALITPHMSNEALTDIESSDTLSNSSVNDTLDRVGDRSLVITNHLSQL